VQRQALTRQAGYLPSGLPALRAAIADLLTVRHGQPAVTEEPTFPGALDALHRAGARPVGVPVGDISRLSDVLGAHYPALIYLIPTHQNPLGAIMSAADRDRVVALARRYPDVTFIDDMRLADRSRDATTRSSSGGPTGCGHGMTPSRRLPR
jgi:DNA-binding transcriptional MocR family regulator